MENNNCPKYLIPLIPLILINGGKGIAVGFSSSVG